MEPRRRLEAVWNVLGRRILGSFRDRGSDCGDHGIRLLRKSAIHVLFGQRRQPRRDLVVELRSTAGSVRTTWPGRDLRAQPRHHLRESEQPSRCGQLRSQCRQLDASIAIAEDCLGAFPDEQVRVAPDLGRQRTYRKRVAREFELALERRANQIGEDAHFNVMEYAIASDFVASGIGQKVLPQKKKIMREEKKIITKK